jgi:hypothetical protein
MRVTISQNSSANSGHTGFLASQLRGSLTDERINARTIVRVSENPHCLRLLAISFVGIAPSTASGICRAQVDDNMSEFAADMGRMFERRLLKDNGARLSKALIDGGQLRESDFSHANTFVNIAECVQKENPPEKIKDPDEYRKCLHKKTTEFLKQKMRGDASAPVLMCQSALELVLSDSRKIILCPDILYARPQEPMYKAGESRVFRICST